MAPKCEPLCRFDDRLYFTTFPHPPPKQDSLNRPGSQLEQVNVRGIPTPPCESSEPTKHYYFTIDDQLMYMSFFQDWGPLNVAMVYKACIYIHSLLMDEDLASHRLILYTSDDPQRKANAALLMALFSLIVQQRAPWEAFQPIAELEFMPFRDAGRGRSDFNLSIQDCLWGMYKAMQNGLCDLNEFDINEYEFYEKVENGDWNWISPHFIALASPMDPAWIKNQKEARELASSVGALVSPAKGAKQRELALQRKLPMPFQNCLEYFEQHNVKIVIRLNNPLYDRHTFLERGINHLELYFDDGTNPSDEIVRRFIDISDEIIHAGGVVAVHCKAGLGRTGTLIGAYLIWKYGFTASEAIAFMRIVRPGCVVGPQQQFMYVKQLEWVKWAAVDEMRRNQAAAALAAAAIIAPVTPPAETDTENIPMDAAPIVAGVSTVPPVTPSKHVAAASARARAAVPPGQPRKTPNTKRVATDSSDDEIEDESEDLLPTLGAAPSITRHKSRVSPKTGVTKLSASEQRPTRVTRSAAAAACKPSKILSTAANKANVTAPPNKIPRLANATSVRVPQKLANLPANRRTARPASPSPSRLPTLVPKRPGHGHHASVSNLGDVALKVPAPRANANEWMRNGVNAVVKPGNHKGERPGLRSVRRRRSSFSAADVVA
ncbi:tyrosine protein phosphatase [Russula earlei]|uniref:Tyrosine protein phosphatase n=1 Tax=Russula earlei TaxID=71964 RepID=A0ACC0UI00_9AGAM|nr:tyrosine protein phosphatase [Russula earlei]